MGATYSCMSQCDTLVYGPNGWMKMGIGNPTGIEELISGQTGGRMYDLLGREIFEIPKGTIYIKNRKKYIK